MLASPPPSTDLDWPTPAGLAQAWTTTDDGQFLMVAHADATIRVWDFGGQSVATKLTPDRRQVVELRPVGGGALARTDRGQLLLVRSDRRRVEIVRRDVRGVSTSPRGEVVAMVLDDEIKVFRVGDLHDEIRSVAGGVNQGVTATALSADGGELSVAYQDGTLIRYNVWSGWKAPALDLGGPVKRMAYDFRDHWLVVQHRDGQLIGLRRGPARSSARDVDRPVKLGEGVVDFDVRRKPLSAALSVQSPFLIAVDRQGRLRSWTDFGVGDDGEEEKVLSKLRSLAVDALQGVAFDYWRETVEDSERAFVLAGREGFVEMLVQAAGTDDFHTQATLMALGKEGWAIIDAENHYDGQARTLDEVKRAQLNRRSADDFGLPLDRFNSGCRVANLFYGLRDLPRGAPCAVLIPAPPAPVTIDKIVEEGDRYSVFFSMVAQDAARIGPATPRLIHQGRPGIGAVAPMTCPKALGGDRMCWKGSLEPVPGVENTVYVSVGATLKSLTEIFNAKRSSKADRPPRLHLVLIGVSAYGLSTKDERCLRERKDSADNAPLCSLVTPVLDLDKLATTLQDALARPGAPLSVAPPIRIYDEPSMATALRIQLASADIRPQDVVWIAISGHGAYYHERKTYYLLGRNATTLTRNYISNHQDEVLSFDALLDMLSSIRARQLILTIDACNAGGAESGIDREIQNPFAQQTNPLGMEVFFAVAQDAKAFDGQAKRDGSIQSSPMMAAMISQVTQAEEARQALTARSLFELTRRDLEARPPAFATDGTTASITQNPLTSSVGSDILILSRPDRPR